MNTNSIDFVPGKSKYIHMHIKPRGGIQSRNQFRQQEEDVPYTQSTTYNSVEPEEVQTIAKGNSDKDNGGRQTFNINSIAFSPLIQTKNNDKLNILQKQTQTKYPFKDKNRDEITKPNSDTSVVKTKSLSRTIESSKNPVSVGTESHDSLVEKRIKDTPELIRNSITITPTNENQSERKNPSEADTTQKLLMEKYKRLHLTDQEQQNTLSRIIVLICVFGGFIQVYNLTSQVEEQKSEEQFLIKLKWLKESGLQLVYNALKSSEKQEVNQLQSWMNMNKLVDQRNNTLYQASKEVLQSTSTELKDSKKTLLENNDASDKNITSAEKITNRTLDLTKLREDQRNIRLLKSMQGSDDQIFYNLCWQISEQAKVTFTGLTNECKGTENVNLVIDNVKIGTITKEVFSMRDMELVTKINQAQIKEKDQSNTVMSVFWGIGLTFIYLYAPQTIITVEGSQVSK